MNRPLVPSVLDFEASGFGSQSYPIEVGVVLDTGERYCSLIRPLDSWTHWDDKAETLHGISRRHLMSAGRDVNLVACDLNELLAGRTVFSDAWSVDKRWLISLFVAAGIEPRFELSPIESIQSEQQHGCWDRVYKLVLRESSDSRHRASNDAFLVQATYCRSRDL